MRILVRTLITLALLLTGLAAPAFALKPITVSPDQDRVELTNLGDVFAGRGDTLTIETAAGSDGTAGRMSVSAVTSGTNPNWVVFALTNPTEKQVERLITADRYNLIGSGAIWPDLDAGRIEAITPSIGFIPERIKSDRADVFRLTLEPGQTITYVAELASDRVPRVQMWKPLDYELKVRERLLFNGAMLGLVGLLATFLTVIFAANHKIIFPAAALVAWCVLGYLCVDFGLFHKLFQLRAEDNAVYRAASEAAIAAALIIFMYFFLRIALWHGLMRMLFSVWVMAQVALVAVAVIDPRLASTFARLSFVGISVFGGALSLFLALRGQDRALSLIPTWILFGVWTFGAAFVLTGKLSGDMVVSGLVFGFVIITLLIGFTVTQFAFRSLEPIYGSAPSEMQTRSLAIDSAGAAVWEWSSRRDEVRVGPQIEAGLGLSPGELSVKTDEFLKHLHASDRERFRLSLWSLQERSDGVVHSEFRMRHSDNTYRWFELEASAVPSSDPRAIKCVGLVRDITDAKRAHERLLQDAVRCGLTGLPNRELFVDRLRVATVRAQTEPQIRPVVIFIDIDRFKSVNGSFGLVVGDSLLLTVARRLQRHLGPVDSLSRVGGDQFAVMLLNDQSPGELAALAERIRRSLRSPIKIAGQEVVLTGSLGLAVFDPQGGSDQDLLKEAEIAMYRAKRGGADRIEIFRPEMRGDSDDRQALEAELRKALEKNQIKILYQPIVYLPTEELAGFEAIVRWEHPKLGLVNPAALLPAAADSDLIVKIGSHVLMRAVRDCAAWQKELPRPDRQLYVSVNVASGQLFRQDLIQEIRHILGRNLVPKGTLKLEVSESLVMENPEQATEILEWLRGAGAELSLDEFGTGYSCMTYLQKFPFDTIKIDRSVMRSGSQAEGGSPTIVRAMVAMAHELGRRVVAEGVASAEDAAFLRGIGCEYAQGPFYREPMTERDVMVLLRMVKKSESKVRPRGLFRTSTSRKRDAPADGVTAASQAAKAGPAQADRKRAKKSETGHGATPIATLPQSSVRARQRPAPNGAASAEHSPPEAEGLVARLAGAKATKGTAPAAPPAPSQVPDAASANPIGAASILPHDVRDGAPPRPSTPPPIAMRQAPAELNGSRPARPAAPMPDPAAAVPRMPLSPPPAPNGGMGISAPPNGPLPPVVPMPAFQPPPPPQPVRVVPPEAGPTTAPPVPPRPLEPPPFAAGAPPPLPVPPANTPLDFSSLPPSIAESLRKLANLPAPPRPAAGPTGGPGDTSGNNAA